MRNIVEQLWYNDFSPSDAVPDTDAYIEAKRKHEKAYDDLSGQRLAERSRRSPSDMPRKEAECGFRHRVYSMPRYPTRSSALLPGAKRYQYTK